MQQQEPSYLCASLSLSFNSFRITCPALHRQDEEEEDEREIMSDHMKDSEVR